MQPSVGNDIEAESFSACDSLLDGEDRSWVVDNDTADFFISMHLTFSPSISNTSSNKMFWEAAGRDIYPKLTSGRGELVLILDEEIVRLDVGVNNINTVEELHESQEVGEEADH